MKDFHQVISNNNNRAGHGEVDVKKNSRRND